MDIRPIISSLRRHKLTVSLMVIEIALTCFIAGGALFVISLIVEKMHVQSGVATHSLVVIRTTGSALEATGGKARLQEDLAALRRIPGVAAVSAVNQFPFGTRRTSAGIRLSPTQNRATVGAATYEGENLIRTFGTHLLAGRDFRADEYVDSDAVEQGKQTATTAIITRALAQRLWPDKKALGKTFYTGHPVRVVGIVAGLLQPASLSGKTAHRSIVLPIRMSVSDAAYVLRTRPDQRQRVIKAAVASLKSIHPHRIFLKKETLDTARADISRGVRSTMHILVGVIVALLLVTMVGMVGLASFWVARRRHTIGVRRALGATRKDILRYFQTENFFIVTVGVAIGMLLTYGADVLLMLTTEMPRMPLWYLPAGALGLWLLGQIAVLGPALRASRVPPVVATRAV